MAPDRIYNGPPHIIKCLALDILFGLVRPLTGCDYHG